MTASHLVVPDDPLIAGTLGVDRETVAFEHVAARALSDGPVGRVGLELELHLVDLAQPLQRPTWEQVETLAASVPPLPSGSPVTLEPGGQIEISTPPADDVVAAVAALRADEAVLRRALREAGFGAAPLGTDPAREIRRINPGARYAAMETHFDAAGCAGCGMEMMTATAALQVNLDAGPASGWRQRVDLVKALVPVLVAMSSTSPYLGGRSSGWHSMRQGTWQGIDHGRSDAVPDGEPAEAWATYALDAPVMLVRDGDTATPLTRRVTFREWLRGEGGLHRAPTLVDLDYHLTTLFPPVRPRGYLELRAGDAMPDRWWPALAAVTATLVDDPVAADEAAAWCEPVADAWDAAARVGLADLGVRRAVLGCLDVAVLRAPAGLRTEVEAFAELLASGSSPSQELRATAETYGPLRVLEEESVA
ncbi:ergothioneine biosynthesis glutamate--cysteine ligase EgtA [Nocardioides mangrovicus]|uniref:Glutamate--cysteine ligase EgtA n=1 Tax=Nocardioides mangrovicus TaxID=2478913 RepID=A0A3L8P3B3_9ACTN|nr:ergothioneine biosynthesis glutamate--cysteine ligase EgtA [Nocardioides mangrovicus]RLV49482.1 ergothioneine biosynthesis glutamate--cysteine ligase EgtA [Nocardioides mangrovicus]